MTAQGDRNGMRHSLRGKITGAYVAVAVAMLLASLFFVGELRTLEARVELGQRVTELFDTVLEIFLELFEIIFFPKNTVILTYIKVQFV